MSTLPGKVYGHIPGLGLEGCAELFKYLAGNTFIKTYYVYINPNYHALLNTYQSLNLYLQAASVFFTFYFFHHLKK
jgi:hypothetical protein